MIAWILSVAPSRYVARDLSDVPIVPRTDRAVAPGVLDELLRALTG